MAISRRWFIGGAAAFGAFGGCRMFETHGFRAGGRPRLRFGVVSDIHIRYFGEQSSQYGGTGTFVDTLRWFDSQGADAVMIAGDMADNGLVEQLAAIGKAWDTVFPGNAGSDGRTVEKLFVYGNHDWEGFKYGGYGEKLYPDKAELERHILRADYGRHWREIFHEDYSPFYRKTVKGYTFLGQHWVDGLGAFGPALKDFLDRERKTLDPAQPFFYFQHPHPNDTCYGPWAWGHDRGDVTAALSPFANAVAFSGHSHYSLTDERSVWQGAFTSVGTSSLRYSGMPYNEIGPRGYENTGSEGKDAAAYNAVKLLRPHEGVETGYRQGMLWSVYDDCISVTRHEFVNSGSLGSDWVIPLPAAESRPFAFAERAKKFSAPEFPAGASLKLERKTVKNRKGEEKDAVVLAFPAIEPSSASRVYRFRVEAKSPAGACEKYLMARGFNAPVAKRLGQDALERCPFALDELPKGEVVFTVTPENWFHTPGQPLSGHLSV